MRFELLLAPQAIDDLKRLHVNLRTEVRDGIELHLRHEPGKTSRSRIKRLRGMRRPQHRLRIGDLRVFYDIDGRSVQVLAIVLKPDAARWLDEEGERS